MNELCATIRDVGQSYSTHEPRNCSMEMSVTGRIGSLYVDGSSTVTRAYYLCVTSNTPM